MSLQKRIDELLAQRASQWVDTLRQGRKEDLDAFVEWVVESPRNLDEFLTIAALDRELSSQGLYASIDKEALLRQIGPPMSTSSHARASASQLSSPALQPARDASQPSSRTRTWWLGALAACLAIVCVLGFIARESLFPTRDFRTAIGEQRSLELPDGSLVYLNARSALRLDFDDTTREVRLIEGEALFKVARDAARPFQVRTRDALVRALGTQFNVASGNFGTRVAVLEGRVQVASMRNPQAPKAALSVGDAAQVAETGSVNVIPRADVESQVAWRQRRLVFVKAPLEEIVDEFNRFNTRRLRVDGLEPGARHYSGTFDADDPEALIAFLEREEDLAIEAKKEEIVIRGR